MVITGRTRNSPELRRFRPHKTLDSSGFQNIKIEYFFLFSPVVLSKSFLNEKTTVWKIHGELSERSKVRHSKCRVQKCT